MHNFDAMRISKFPAFSAFYLLRSKKEHVFTEMCQTWNVLWVFHMPFKKERKSVIFQNSISKDAKSVYVQVLFQ